MATVDPLQRVLDVADAVDAAIDARASAAELAILRRLLDESFAGVLDLLVADEHRAYRAALVDQYCRLAGSLDAFERRS